MQKRTLISIYMLLTSCLILGQTTQEGVNFMENMQGVGARAQALGNAYVGLANDYTALYWNPAGLAQLYRSEISGDFYHLNFKNSAEFQGNSTSSEENYSRLKSLGFAYKFPTTQGNFVLAFGYNRIKDYDDFLGFSGYNTESNELAFELPDADENYAYYDYDRDVQQTEQIFTNGHLGAWTLGGGIQMSPSFSLGMAVNFYSGKNEYLFDFFQDDVDNLYNTFPADFDSYELHQKIDTRFGGTGFKVGGLFKVTNDLQFGVNIDLPTRLKVMETFSENDVLIFDDGYEDAVVYDKTDWEYFVKFPYKYSFGASLDLKKIVLTASAEYRDWSQVRFEKSDDWPYPEDYDNLLAENRYFESEFREVLSYSAGAEVRVPGTKLTLRGGYNLVPSPLADADSELDKQYLSGGFGVKLDHATIFNFSYTKGSWKRYTSDLYTPGGTKEEIETTKVLAGLTFLF